MSPRRAILLAVAAAAATVPSLAAAQWGGALSLQEGDSVRLRLPGALRVDGALQGMRSDTLILRMQGLDGSWPVSGFDLVSLERYGDRSPRQGLRHGVVLGMVSGVFAGAAFGVLLNVAVSGERGEPTVEMLNSAMKWAGLGAVFGAVGGGVQGGRRPGRGWIGVDLPVR